MMVLENAGALKHNIHIGGVNMNRLSTQERARILHCLVEGNSMRATSRMCDVSINTVAKLLVDVGNACADYQDKAMRDLSVWRQLLFPVTTTKSAAHYAAVSAAARVFDFAPAALAR